MRSWVHRILALGVMAVYIAAVARRWEGLYALWQLEPWSRLLLAGAGFGFLMVMFGREFGDYVVGQHSHLTGSYPERLARPLGWILFLLPAIVCTLWYAVHAVP